MSSRDQALWAEHLLYLQGGSFLTSQRALSAPGKGTQPQLEKEPVVFFVLGAVSP